MILEHKLVRMFLEIPEYKDVESRKANKQQKSKCTRQIDYLNSWNGKQSTRFRSGGKQLKNPSVRQRPIISGGIRCSLTSPSSLFAFFVRSLDSAAVKCLECFFAQLWSVFLFEKAPGGSSSSSATEYEEAGHSRSRDCSFPFFQRRLCGGVAQMLSPLELMLL